MKVDVAAISDTGRVREINEDSFLIDKELFVFAVADGMGGHAAGEIASATAIETIRASTAAGIDIARSIEKAHESVKKKSAQTESLSGMGTTLTAMGFSAKKKIVIAHVGDSRAYLFKRNIDGASTLERITKDHSLVEELVDAGQITEEEANVHPRRSVITRALGIDGDVEVDEVPIDFKIGSRFLICSDGLSSMVRDEDIADILNSNPLPSDAARELVARANKAGGNDNITVVVIDVTDEEIIFPDSIKVAQSVPADEKKQRVHDKSGRFVFVVQILLVILFLGAILGGAFFVAKNYATKGYFLDEKNGEVVLMKGRYGGVLWWDPTLDSQSGIEVKKMTSADKVLVERNARFETRSVAVKRLDEIRKRQKEKEVTTETTTTTTTTIPDGQTDIILSPATAATND